LLRYAFRRLLLTIPTLIGTSLVVFLVTTLVPDPAVATLTEQNALLARDRIAYERLEEQRRERFLDLPRFFNPQPHDVHVLADDCIMHISANDEVMPLATYRLERAGGAALPYVLPNLDKLAPGARGRVAVALAPVGERMGLGDSKTLRDPQEAVLFWQRFWEDRELDFTGPAVRRTIARLVQRPTEERETDIEQVDTFALPELIRQMQESTDRVALGRLMAMASHARGGLGPRIAKDATDEEVGRAVEAWVDWWYANESDYVALGGAQKVAATFSETRYGKWLLRVATGNFGRSARDGELVLDKIRQRAEVTMTLAFLALFLAYAGGIPLGVLAAWRRGKRIDSVTSTVVIVLHAIPTFVTAAALGVFATGLAGKLTLGVVALAIGSFATISRQQRASMLDVLGQDFVRTARAKGAYAARVLVVHALRNALVPIVALAGTQLPLLVGGAFVVEVVFNLQGLGWECLRAIQSRDAQVLVGTLFVVAIATTLALAVSDVAHGLLDPRVRARMTEKTEGLQ
jgi:ABC-type dipeptide/oligopeptide/nickel transport system permease component